MNLKCETILDFYTHKNRKIYCQIKCHKLKNTCRSLTSEQWNTFDKELEKLLDSMNLSEDENKENLGKFTIRPNIEVKVQKSKLSLSFFCNLLSSSGDYEKYILRNAEDIKDVSIVLECMLDLLDEANFALTHKAQEYEPSLEGNLPTSLSYEPYTPTKTRYCSGNGKTAKNSAVDLFNYNEDTYSPMPLFAETTTTKSIEEIIPKYKPAPINENLKSTTNGKTADNIFVPKSKEEYIPEAQKISACNIPAYVPTPIDWSSTRKEMRRSSTKSYETFENKRLRSRSKTVDAMTTVNNQSPKLISIKSTEPLNENICIRETHSSGDSDKSDYKFANEVIMNTDDENVPSQNYRPLRLKSKKAFPKENEFVNKSNKKEAFFKDMQTNCVDKDATITKEGFKGVHDLPEILHDFNKKSNKTSKTPDSILKELEKDKKAIKTNKKLGEDETITNSDFRSHKSKKKGNESSATNGKEKKFEKNKEKILQSTSSSEDEYFCETSKKVKKQKETHPKISENNFKHTIKVDKRNCLSSPELNSIADTSPATDIRKCNKSEQSNITSLRRSDRSPNKPKRFIEEISGVDPNRQNKLKKFKISPKNKELFGSDDDNDDDNDFENNVGKNNLDKNNIMATVTPDSKKPTKYLSSSTSSSVKQKRKANSSNDCEQEKRDISKWLSKKKTSVLDPEPTVLKKCQRSKSPSTKSSSKTSKSCKKSADSKNIRSESVTPTCEDFDMPSKKELEEIRNKSKLKQKENEKLKAELDKMRATPPKEVEHLSLQDMSLSDILDTFSTYKSDLDEIYRKNCKRDYIKGHDGINHCFVIQLLKSNVQMKMLEKLTEVYSNSKNSMQATLYANALLPEWIIRVYMEKFNFTRQEAIDQIKAQDDYRLHMEEQNDGSFIFN